MSRGPLTRTSFKVTLSGKKPISGSPRAETSRPVQLAICSPIRAFKVSRGTSATSSTNSAAAATTVAARIKATRFIRRLTPNLCPALAR